MRFKFKTLVTENKDPVYTLAMRSLGNGSDAEDVCQEVFIRLWKNFDSLVDEQIRPWLLTVTRNLCIDQLRKRKDTDELDELAHHSSLTSLQPHTALTQFQLSEWLKNAIEGLKEPYKSLLILSDLKQMSVKEIAMRSDLNENQIKVYIHRARKKLRDALTGVEL